MLKYFCDKKRHLVCVPYSVENLHAMAADLGLKRGWYHGGQAPHYDIPKRRIAEITARCTIVSQREIFRIIKGGHGPITDTTPCCCGHVYDEHDEGTCCTVPDCKCIHFEEDHNQD